MTSEPDWFYMELQDAAEASRAAADADNSARRGVVELTYTASGYGQHRVTTPVRFGISFTQEPHLITGSGLISNPAYKTHLDPRGTAGVYKWLTNDKGHFVGAFIWSRVDVEGIRGTAGHPTWPSVAERNAATKVAQKMRTLIYLTFSGMSFKDVKSTGMTDTVTPRTTPMTNGMS